MDYLSCPYGETRTRTLNKNILNNNRNPPSSCLSVSPNNIAKTMRDNDTFNERKVFLILLEIGESRRLNQNNSPSHIMIIANLRLTK